VYDSIDVIPSKMTRIAYDVVGQQLGILPEVEDENWVDEETVGMAE